ncbi:nuclear transport factor 2 family protein [Actinomadura barringtoniae]|uniref:Nuclear transport factor 2 family protein n=1 Tax=Actinomadura barringtoniae TaxID=1427535 RepID=A0A939PF42_9ACTN|nr:nuclear transport factor 2 family protein [Actinomadura barringtoniae]MBO2451138.1 nuclear transport factor 2 family protein [Actinomadura barringtoniae]
MHNDPIEVLERRRAALVARDMDAFVDLFVEDAVIEMPFHVEGQGLPDRLEGREAIRAFSARTRDMPFEITDLETRALHRTADPEVVVLELTTVGRMATTGEDFTVPCIQVFRIRDGRIVLFRDYVAAQALPAELNSSLHRR